jgi:hypothetical protein
MLAAILAAISSTTIMISSEEDPETRFWNWFGDHHDKYRSVDRAEDGEELLSRFLEELHRYDEDLYFEVSEPLEDGSNELIITAEGLRKKFPAVKALVDAAPKFQKWKVIAFKPALGFDFIHEYGDLKIDPKKLWFLPLTAKSDPSILGLRVGLDGLEESTEEKIKNSIWIILDTGLGEEVCAERIRHLEVATLPEKPEDEGFMEMSELPDYLAWIEKRNDDAFP